MEIIENEINRLKVEMDALDIKEKERLFNEKSIKYNQDLREFNEAKSEHDLLNKRINELSNVLEIIETLTPIENEEEKEEGE